MKNIDKYKDVSLSFGRTPRQIAVYKKIRGKLSEPVAIGEKGLKIKCVDGYLKIVQEN